MIKYKDLPKEFQNESVKKYYEIVSKKRLSLVFKRIFDIIFSVLTLIILLIPIFIISIAIKLDSKGSVFLDRKELQGMVRNLKFLNLEQWFQTLIKSEHL